MTSGTYKVSFARNGIVTVTNNKYAHSVVVGKAEKSGQHGYSTPGFWSLASYANKESGPMYAYYGKKKSDLIPFAIGIYGKIIWEGRVDYNA